METARRVGRTMTNHYNEYSNNQLAAHKLTYPALHAATARVLTLVPQAAPATLCISDMGCAGGGNAMALLREVQHAVDEAKARHGGGWDQLATCVYLEDLPGNDWNVVGKVLAAPEAKEFFKANRIHPRMLAQGFYEPLFPPASMHLALSYITLHWLSSTPQKPAGADWVSPHERQVPPAVLEEWRAAADRDLLLFLSLRAEELVDGGEGVFLMVGGGAGDSPQVHDWLRPLEGAALFTQAFRRAANAGEVRADALANAVIPYFLRSEADVRRVCEQLDGVLEVVALDSAPLEVGQVEHDPSADPAVGSLAWSIHEACLRTSSGCSEAEMDAVRRHFMDLHREHYPRGTCHVAYTALAVRRRPRV
eukprot:TRINITY_DN479_c0_g2_i2.p1 TRINITY_DN479_c0_g2~~TRINITY_DN479_c0_g2_i2.p1  ORF type:complete len:365 (+),score=103.78 TRINITY_DN479_c0_g2_i2:52-1146(+)